mmetsp:Transcript_28670/g.58640  ORF Transcript_28670/g.58640 Transcript_28670/m.58640 type:complete len:122 (+) Transcript_28670:745-1110(+)
MLQHVERLWRKKDQKAGVGIVFQVSDEGALVVASLVPDGPAERSGKVAAGDVLYEVDGVNVYRAHQLKVADLVVGVEGSKVCLGLKRGMRYEGDGIFRVELTKAVMDKVGLVERFRIPRDA